MAKFDIKSEATRGLYAGAGAADLAVAAVKVYVADVQKRIEGVQKDVTGRVDGVQKSVSSFTPKSLRDQAITVVNTRVEALTEDAKARRAAVEGRVAELQAEAKALPTRMQTLVNDNVTTANETYVDLAKHGESVVKKLRSTPEAKQTVKDAKTTVSKARTATTQAKAAGSTTKKAAADVKKSATTARKTVTKKAAPARSSAKATGTAAAKTVTAAVAATEKAVETAGSGE
jgi:hypothetical protein